VAQRSGRMRMGGARGLDFIDREGDEATEPLAAVKTTRDGSSCAGRVWVVVCGPGAELLLAQWYQRARPVSVPSVEVQNRLAALSTG
jgi:hypothetical protein